MQRLCIIYPQVPHTIQHNVLCIWTRAGGAPTLLIEMKGLRGEAARRPRRGSAVVIQSWTPSQRARPRTPCSVPALPLHSSRTEDHHCPTGAGTYPGKLVTLGGG